MEIKTGTDVYNSLNYTAVQTVHSERECENLIGEAKIAANSENGEESSAVIYEKSEQMDFPTYSVSSIQGTSDYAAIAKAKAYLGDMRFYDSELEGYNDELKKRLNVFRTLIWVDRFIMWKTEYQVGFKTKYKI